MEDYEEELNVSLEDLEDHLAENNLKIEIEVEKLMKEFENYAVIEPDSLELKRKPVPYSRRKRRRKKKLETKLKSSEVKRKHDQRKLGFKSRRMGRRKKQQPIILKSVKSKKLEITNFRNSLSKILHSEISEVRRIDQAYSLDENENKESKINNMRNSDEEIVDKTMNNILQGFGHTFGILSEKGYLSQEEEKRERISQIRKRLKSLKYGHVEIRSFISKVSSGNCYKCIIRTSRKFHKNKRIDDAMVMVAKFLFAKEGIDRNILFMHEYPVDQKNQNLDHKNLVEIVLTNSEMKVKSTDLLEDKLAHSPKNKLILKNLREAYTSFGDGIVMVKYYPLTLRLYLELRKYTKRLLQISEVCYLLKGLLEGAKYLNDHKICHGDLNLSNIFLEVKDLYSRVIIGDLGSCINFNLRPGKLKGVMMVTKEDEDYEQMMLMRGGGSHYSKKLSDGIDFKMDFVAPEIRSFYENLRVKHSRQQIRCEYSNCDMYSIGKIGNMFVDERYFDSSVLDNDNEMKIIISSSLKGLLYRMTCDNVSSRIQFDESLIVLNDIIDRIEYRYKASNVILFETKMGVKRMKNDHENESNNYISNNSAVRVIENREEQEYHLESEEIEGEEIDDDDDVSGNVYTWGFGRLGGLGHGKTKKEIIPKLVKKLVPYDVKNVFCGWNGCCSVLLTNGSLLSWGNNFKRLLGHEKENHSVLSPKSLVRIPEDKRRIVQVTHGGYNSFFLDNFGDVWGCGNNSYGYLTGKKSDECFHQPVKIVLSPKIHKIVSGSYHFGCICSSGRLYTWGDGGYGRLGHENTSDVLQPQIVKFFENIRVKDVSMGYIHSLVLSEDGNVYGFGHGSYGQLGNGKTSGSITPLLIDYFCDTNSIVVSKISSGSSHSGCIDSVGNIYMWGRGEFGQIGNGSFREKNSIPFRITSFMDSSGKRVELDVPNRHKFVQLECGDGYNIAILEEQLIHERKRSYVLTWGNGYYGSLGMNSEDNVNIPTVVPFFEKHKMIERIHSKGSVSVAII